MGSNTTIVRHVYDEHGKPLCGRRPASKPPEPHAPVCSACKVTLAYPRPG